MGAAVGYHAKYKQMVCEDFAGGFSSTGSAKPDVPKPAPAPAPKPAPTPSGGGGTTSGCGMTCDGTM